MLETDSLHQPIVVDDLDADWLLSLCEDAEREVWAAERRRLRYALRWAQLHPADPDEVAKGRVEPVGGEGTPVVEELSTEPLAAALRITPYAAMQLVSDALDLAHRLPRLWARVEALEVPVWRARRIAQATRLLTLEQAAAVDRVLAPIAGTCGVVRIDRTIAEVIARTTPTEQAADEVAFGQRHWKVRLFHGPATGPGRWVGTSVLEITGDTAGLSDLYDHLTATAIEAGRAGDPDPIDVRRAKAATGLVRSGGGPHGPRRTRLHLHVDLADLSEGTTGIGAAERLGPITVARIKDWLSDSAVTVLPVLRMDRDDAVDQHDPPAWMRELVILRDGHCVHPYCQTDARAGDLDHLVPYVDTGDGGPPGQTSPENLACLCRRHHRSKTRDRWRYRRLPAPPGQSAYLWTDPHGREYVVDRSGTHAIR